MEYYAKPNKTIAQHNFDLQQARECLVRFGYLYSEEENRILREAIEYHDLGKMNEFFQKRVLSQRKIKFNTELEVEHNILSIYMIDPKKYPKEKYYSILYAVLFHHRYSDVVQTMVERKKDIERLLQNFTSYRLPMGLKISSLHTLTNQKTLGLLMKCDYAASGNYQIEYPNDFLEEKLELWSSKLGILWNDLQEFCYSHKNESIIAIADTGMGKTEAALRWIGNSKAFFTLPIRTAINAIYDRVSRDILERENLEERLSLLHSTSLEYYAKNIAEEELDIFEYHQRGKHLSLPLTICTADQIFNFILKYKGYEMKLATLSYSKVVLDEIQMYDPSLLAAIILGIKTILELGGKIGIVTATFPPIVEALMKKEIPDFSFQKQIFHSKNNVIRHNLISYDKRMGTEEMIDLFLRNKKIGKSNKILVVCNTIKDAQAMYDTLLEQEELSPYLHLLHSRFIKEDRARKEKEILAFGKTEIKENGIWISTQLVEASLDIDFDYLFTELQDLSSLFQRFGRCNRKGKKSTKEANCYVYLKTEEGYLKEAGSSYGFIDKVIYHLSREALLGHTGEISEELKTKWIEEFLSYEKLEQSSFLSEFRDAIEEYKNILNSNENTSEELTRLRDIQNVTVIPLPVYQKHEEEIRDLEENLKNSEMTKEEKLRFKEEIMKHTVTVPKYMLENYKKALQDGNVDCMPVSSVKISNYEKVIILECLYDSQRGFQAKKFVEKNINFAFL